MLPMAEIAQTPVRIETPNYSHEPSPRKTGRDKTFLESRILQTVRRPKYGASS